MGDRCDVYIQIPAEYKDQVTHILDPTQHWETVHGLAEFCIPEVNYANIEAETQALTREGIPHSWYWTPGGGYDSGKGYVRFTAEGEVIYHDYSDPDVNPCIDHVIKLLETKTSEEVLEYLREYKAKYSPQSWDNQVEYGKVYKLKQLVSQ